MNSETEKHWRVIVEIRREIKHSPLQADHESEGKCASVRVKMRA
jgi:hypothetical protein